MSVFQHPEFDRHQGVHFYEDPASGLRCIVAVHSTALGPAAGGCRLWRYPSDDDALSDVLRLSRGMTCKNAIAGLPFGGGKAVILAPESGLGTPALFSAFGRVVESLGGTYITAEDVGVSVDDMRIVRQQTAFVSGLPQALGNAGGDPSPWTALGVFLSIVAAAKRRLGVGSLEGLSVAVQGVGNVGLHLCRLLHDAGAKLLVSDVNRANLRRAREQLPLTVVPAGQLLSSDVDILAPCALGSVLNEQAIPLIRATVVAGAANNQLATEADGARLADRGILYAPDYVINAGGVISVAREYLGQATDAAVRDEVKRIPRRLDGIFDEADASSQPTNIVADNLAKRIVAGTPAATDAPSPERLIA